jgi:hypothetical protein
LEIRDDDIQVFQNRIEDEVREPGRKFKTPYIVIFTIQYWQENK